jgi:hypothetical protein
MVISPECPWYMTPKIAMLSELISNETISKMDLSQEDREQFIRKVVSLDIRCKDLGNRLQQMLEHPWRSQNRKDPRLYWLFRLRKALEMDVAKIDGALRS